MSRKPSSLSVIVGKLGKSRREMLGKLSATSFGSSMCHISSSTLEEKFHVRTHLPTSKRSVLSAIESRMDGMLSRLMRKLQRSQKNTSIQFRFWNSPLPQSMFPVALALRLLQKFCFTLSCSAQTSLTKTKEFFSFPVFVLSRLFQGIDVILPKAVSLCISASALCVFWFMGVVPHAKHHDSVFAVWFWTGVVQSTRVSLRVLVSHSLTLNCQSWKYRRESN